MSRKGVSDWDIAHPPKSDNGNNGLLYRIHNGQVVVVDVEEKESKPKEEPAVNEKQEIDKIRGLKGLDVIAFNSDAEALFVRLLSKQISEADEKCIALDRVIANFAFKLDVSTETIKRYLLKHTADEAEFYVINKKVCLRS